jgi:hypothetical protein
MTKKALIKVAKLEIAAWRRSLPEGLVLAILFAFIHRAVEGEPIEETFFKPVEPVMDYEI